MIQAKVRDFGTPDSRKERHRNLDAIMNNDNNEKVMSMTDANGFFQDAADKVDFRDRADLDQPQNLKETQAPAFII